MGRIDLHDRGDAARAMVERAAVSKIGTGIQVSHVCFEGMNHHPGPDLPDTTFTTV